MSTTTEIKKAMLSMDKTLVDKNNLEIPPNSIIHCLDRYFKLPIKAYCRKENR